METDTSGDAQPRRMSRRNEMEEDKFFSTAGQATGVYRRINVKVRCGKRTYDACTYLMTKETRAARRGRPYPAWYRSICSMGAQWHGIEDEFKVRNTSG